MHCDSEAAAHDAFTRMSALHAAHAAAFEAEVEASAVGAAGEASSVAAQRARIAHQTMWE